MSEERAVERLAARSDVATVEVDGNGISIELTDGRVGGPFPSFCDVLSWIARPSCGCFAAAR